MNDIAIVNAPFGALDRPALGASLLQAGLEAAGFGCDVLYLNYDFAECVGSTDYNLLQSELPYIASAGDFCFARAAFGADSARDGEYIDSILRQTWHLPAATIARVQRVRAAATEFVTAMLQRYDWQHYRIVGFTSTFEQNLASLALARALRAAYPHLSIVFGGANWEGEMGRTLHEHLPFIDFVCAGEADVSFPRLVARLLRGRDRGRLIPGVIERRAGRSVSGGPAARVEPLDALPIPEYRDFFARLDASEVALDLAPTVLLETARGCWWGAKSHCTFCGLNGATMAFRSKSPQRVRDELLHLTTRWRTRSVRRGRQHPRHALLRHAVARAGGTGGAGAPVLGGEGQPAPRPHRAPCACRRDSHSTRHREPLRRRAGAHAQRHHWLRNIQLLKWCREFGVGVDWNILYGFPGETRAERDEELGRLRAIPHLEAPGAVGPIRLDRFSPYFQKPGEHGLRNLRPLPVYRFLYPFAPEVLARIAYSFEFDYAPEVDPGDSAAEVITHVNELRAAKAAGDLLARPQPDGSLCLDDTRTGFVRKRYALRAGARAAYEAVDALRTAAEVAQRLGTSEAAAQAQLEQFVARGLCVRDAKHFLALAVAAPAVDTGSGTGDAIFDTVVMSANQISVQVILAADDHASATACAAGFAELGFTTGPAFAGSFALIGPRAAFRRAFGVVPDGTVPELALDRLAPKLRRVIRAVVSTPPPAFGPGNP